MQSDLLNARSAGAPADEDGQHPERAFALPVFGVADGKLTCQYSRTYVEQRRSFRAFRA